MQIHSNAETAVSPTPPYAVDFEGFNVGSIHGKQGWTVEQGKAEIVNTKAFGGNQSLRLAPSSPFAQAKLSLEPGAMPKPVMFLDFRILPAATLLSNGGPGADELLDIDGARIGLFRKTSQDNIAQIWAFNGDGVGGGTWVQTGASISVKPENGVSESWARISLRQDFKRQSWDLWVEGNICAANLGFQETPISHTSAYILLGDASQPTHLDELSIQSLNPLTDDKDSDGIPDKVEIQLGSDPLNDDRDLFSSQDGKSFFEAYLGMGRQTELDANAQDTITAPITSHAAGIVKSAFTLQLTVREGFRILYTTDGSDPRRANSEGLGTEVPKTAPENICQLEITKSSLVRAVAVSSTGKFSPVVTSAYLFPEQILHQKKPENIASATSDESYWHKIKQEFQIPFGLQSRADLDSAAFTAALESAPIVVLAAPLETWFKKEDGIYSNASQKGSQWKRDVTVQAIGQKQLVRTADATVSISGQSSRYHDVTLKHSFRLRFHASGADMAPLFGTGRFACRDIVLRNPTHDSWAVSDLWKGNRDSAKYLADAWANAWLQKAGHPHLYRRFVHVFLNEVYWGVYEAVEQQDAQFGSRHDGHNVTDLLEGVTQSPVSAIFGSNEDWKALRSEVTQASSQERLGKPASWETIESRIDIDNLIDYVLWNCWLTNLDWPQHNYLVVRIDGVWRFLNWDAEFSIRKQSGVETGVFDRLAQVEDGPAFLFCEMATRASFRQRVNKRVNELVASNGLLSPAELVKSFKSIQDKLRPVIPAEAARWGGVYQSPAARPQDWEGSCNWVMENYIPKRTPYFMNQLAAWLKRQEMDVQRSVASRSLPPKKPIKPSMPNSSGRQVVDSDGDGLPDVWEDANGLDKNDSADAIADEDGDGLNNLTESLLKTELFRPNNPTNHLTKQGGAVYNRLNLRKPKDEKGRIKMEAHLR